jgi:uncharacterized protein (TIGR00297 family)
VIERILTGLLLAVLLSAGAYRLRALSLNGAIAATLIGTTVVGAGGWKPAILLVLFFLSSSLFTRMSQLLKPDRQASFAKGGRRDARQVLANGVMPALFSLLMQIFPEVNWSAGIVGALAAATADTWATEWGVLARRQPRRITDWHPVPTGTSGGITPLGIFGSALGALLIAAAAGLLDASAHFLILGLISGLVGSILDSVLGATVQVQYRCKTCDEVTEQNPTHKVCGTETSYHSGIRWVDNDVVNLVANASGALLALIWMR